MRLFFRDVANACGKTWVLLSKCTSVRPSSLRAPNTSWTPCRISEVADGRRGRGEQYSDPKGKNFVGKGGKRHYAKMNNSFVASEVDIIGGHMKVGTADNVFAAEDRGRVRHVVFLREPLERYVSGTSVPLSKSDTRTVGLKVSFSILRRAVSKSGPQTERDIRRCRPEDKG